MERTSYTQGFVGLIALLIGVAIIAFAMWKVYPSAKDAGDGEVERTPPLFDAINQAEEAKNLLESRYRE
jgi:hypothetical protein